MKGEVMTGRGRLKGGADGKVTGNGAKGGWGKGMRGKGDG
jgi:hypothetical protein